MLDSRAMLGLIGGITAIVTAVFAIRKLYQWLFPIRVEPSFKVVFDGSEPDEIQARIINRSRETQYLIRCEAKSTYSLYTIIKRHLCNPLTPPRLYPNIWFNIPSFGLLGSAPLKIEPFEPVELRHRLSNHPLSVFFTPMFQIEVQLSSGRVFRSKRLDVPARWRFRQKI